MSISVREMKLEDSEGIVDYFLKADPEFITGMGAYPEKLPERDKWLEILHSEFRKPYREKSFYYIIWVYDHKPVGHSNINDIIYGQDARMHLHLWHTDVRSKGLGLQFLSQTIPYYFKNFRLKKINCDPYALNPAPFKTLEKVGFEFIKEYETTPGWINFHQTVKHYELSRERFEAFSRINHKFEQ
jgi:RimJ/RimL family protein N-acetyltransferase